MPASRTTHTRHGSRQPQPAPQGNIAPEIIVLSSDDDEPAPRRPPVKRVSRPQPKARIRPVLAAPPQSQVVVDIASDDDVPPKSVPKAKAQCDIEVQLEAAKKKIAALQKSLAAAERQASAVPHDVEVRRLATEAESAKTSKQQLLMVLEDQICCEICTLKMWNAWTLDCGHTFCFDCLQDWFSTILAQHMNAHPNYTPNPPGTAQYLHAVRSGLYTEQQLRILRREMQEHYDRMQHPSYTCPSCRVSIKTKPSEAFAVKNVVRAVATAQGEASPRKRGTHNVRRNDTWEGFFPTALAS